MELIGGRRPKLKKPSRRGLTAAKKEIFFETLATTCNVAAAVRAARIGTTTVYRERQKSAEFRTRWASAVRESYAHLELMLLERAMNGTVRTVTRADGSVERIHEYPNSVALTLLRSHRDTAEAEAVRHEPEDVEEIRDRLARRIEKLRARIEREAAAV